MSDLTVMRLDRWLSEREEEAEFRSLNTQARPDEPSPVSESSTVEAAPETTIVYPDPSVSADMIEGLPRKLVEAYADLALNHAKVREVDPGVWAATVPGVQGPWGDGDDPHEAKATLREAIIGWVAVKRRVGARDIPPLGDIDLNLG